MAQQAWVYLGFSSLEGLGVLLHPLDGMPSITGLPRSIKFAGTHLYTWVEKGTVRVRTQYSVTGQTARARTGRSGVEHSYQEATVPLVSYRYILFNRPTSSKISKPCNSRIILSAVFGRGCFRNSSLINFRFICSEDPKALTEYAYPHHWIPK